MRVLPTKWPDPAEPAKEVPKVYLRLLDSAWPPASSVDDEDLPAGTTVVTECKIKMQLRAPLLPGQISSDTKFTVAEATCKIPQREGGLLAPWRPGVESTPTSGRCELIASYDGIDGGSAYLLGRFILDPIKGRLSDAQLEVSMIQDLVRLRRDHSIPNRNPNGFGGSSWANSVQLVQYAAESAGFAFATEGAFVTGLEFAYFPWRTDQLTAMEQVITANLAAMYLSMDGATIRVLGPDYLKATGAIDETLDVMARFADLAWTQDPNDAVDRIEVIWVPPMVDDGPEGPTPFNTGRVWTAPKGASLAAGGTWSFEFDPGNHIAPQSFGNTFQIVVNERKDGTGVSSTLNGAIVEHSSGHFAVSIFNTTGDRKYFTLPYDAPGTQDRGWGVSKGTPSFIPGTSDEAKENDNARTLAWGVSAESASNTLRFDLGRLVQYADQAADIFNRVVARVTTPTYVVENVDVVPHLGRELGDLHRIHAAPYGFDQRALVTGIDITITSKQVAQTLSYAIFPLIAGD